MPRSGTNTSAASGETTATNPLFTTPGSVWTLQATSPAIDAGVTVHGFNDTYNANLAGHRRVTIRCTAGASLYTVIGAITAIACALRTSSRRADGDPASDVLIAHTYFVPADARVSARQEAQLGALLAATARAGLDVRVAVIANVYDLGSALQAWLKPQAYAEFLGYEPKTASVRR